MDNLDLEKIQKIVDMAKKRNIADFSIESKEFKLSFSFVPTKTIHYPISTVSAVPQISESSIPAKDQIHKPAVSVEGHKKETGKEIKAPFVGTFYASSGPGEPAYVKVGDKIKKGQTLCILEAMKIMNEIESDVDGVVAEICLENESFVEFGQVLFKIK